MEIHDFYLNFNVTSGDGRIHVFCVGADHHIYVRVQTDGGAGWDAHWTRIGMSATSNIAAIAGTDGRVSIFVRGLDYAIWTKTCPTPAGPWQPDDDGWVSLNGRSLTDPVVVAAQDGRLEVYAVGMSHQPECTYQKSDGNWAGWVSLGGGTIWTAPELRLDTVSLETGDARTIEESGRFTDNVEPIVRISDAVMASSAIPAIFPSVNLNGQNYVDGGVRETTPIMAAINAGADAVFAIECSSAHPDPTHPHFLAGIEKVCGGPEDPNATFDTFNSASLVDVAFRSVMDLIPNSITEKDLLPPVPYPVNVYIIQPTFDIHDVFTIDPDLIRMSMDYGWMRAFDTTCTADVSAAMASSDDIMRQRRQIWIYEKLVKALEGNPTATVLLGLQLRPKKRALAAAVASRTAAGFDVPPGWETWARVWEVSSLHADLGGNPFDAILGYPAEPAP